VLVVLLLLIVLWLWRDVRHTRQDLRANQRTLKAIAAEIAAEGQRQEDVARKLEPPGDEGDDPDKRHLKGLPPMAPVIGFISATGGYVLSAAQEHPREAVALVAAATAGAGVLIWGATQPGHHYAPSAGNPPAAVTSAPTTIRPSPTVRPVPSRKTYSRPARMSAVPVAVPSGKGPGQSPTEPDVPVPTSHPPEPSAPAPTRTVPPPRRSTPRPSPTTAPTKIAPPMSAVPTYRPPHPTAPPTPKPAHCIIGVNLLGTVQVCVGSTGPPASTGP
jgi:hypothetical protein